LLDTISQNPNVKEITVLAHSMGCELALEALRERATRLGKVGDKIKNVLLLRPTYPSMRFKPICNKWAINRPGLLCSFRRTTQLLSYPE
jgi:alpha-beta hydrolase superfamily lysophospholipase